MRDPETQRRGGRTVPRMRPHSEPTTRPPIVADAVARPEPHAHRVVAVVTIAVDTPGRLPDVYVSARAGTTWIGAVTKAEDAASALVPAGRPFQVSARQRIDSTGRLVPAPPAS